MRLVTRPLISHSLSGSYGCVFTVEVQSIPLLGYVLLLFGEGGSGADGVAILDHHITVDRSKVPLCSHTLGDGG